MKLRSFSTFKVKVTVTLSPAPRVTCHTMRQVASGRVAYAEHRRRRPRMLG